MNKRLKKLIYSVLSVIIIFCLWHLFSVLQDNNYLLPDIKSTFSALFSIVSSRDFFITVLYTLSRVVIGLSLGVVLGVALAVVSHTSEAVRSLLSPIISIIKSTPVASFIVILWIKLSGNELAIFIALLMVLPIIWQNVLDGYDSLDKGLSEVCLVYSFSFKKKFRLLILPALLKYFIPGLITATGLAWKAEIAAEIIAYTGNSIGQKINDAKYYLDSPTVFAWTLIVITLSILLEIGTKALIGRCKKWTSN